MLIITDEKEVRFLNNKCNPCTTTIYFELFLFLSTGCFHFIDASLLSRKRSIPRWIKGAFSMRSFYLPFTLSIPSLNFKNHYSKTRCDCFSISFIWLSWLIIFWYALYILLFYLLKNRDILPSMLMQTLKQTTYGMQWQRWALNVVSKSEHKTEIMNKWPIYLIFRLVFIAQYLFYNFIGQSDCWQTKFRISNVANNLGNEGPIRKSRVRLQLFHLFVHLSGVPSLITRLRV